MTSGATLLVFVMCFLIVMAVIWTIYQYSMAELEHDRIMVESGHIRKCVRPAHGETPAEFQWMHDSIEPIQLQEVK